MKMLHPNTAYIMEVLWNISLQSRSSGLGIQLRNRVRLWVASTWEPSFGIEIDADARFYFNPPVFYFSYRIQIYMYEIRSKTYYYYFGNLKFFFWKDRGNRPVQIIVQIRRFSEDSLSPIITYQTGRLCLSATVAEASGSLNWRFRRRVFRIPFAFIYACSCSLTAGWLLSIFCLIVSGSGWDYT